MNEQIIHSLVNGGDTEALRQLLREAPESVHAKNTDGDTALHLACWMKRLDMARLLLDYKAMVNEKGLHGFTPLHYAVFEGDARSAAIVKLLLEYGADPGLCDDKDFTPAEFAKMDMDEGLTEVLGYLEKKGDGNRPAESQSWPQIHELAYVGDESAVRQLLATNPRLVHLKDPYGNMPLHIACWAKQIGMINCLCSRGADVNASGYLGRTPLHYVVHEGRPLSAILIGSLLCRGADPGLRDDMGHTPAEWAKIQMKEGLERVLQELSRREERQV